jgi:hypothetical protein
MQLQDALVWISSVLPGPDIRSLVGRLWYYWEVGPTRRTVSYKTCAFEGGSEALATSPHCFPAARRLAVSLLPLRCTALPEAQPHQDQQTMDGNL